MSQQLSLPLSPSARKEVQRQNELARQDQRCLHCFLVGVLSDRDLHPETNARDYWQIVGHKPPRLGHAFGRLLFKEASYLNDANPEEVAKMLKLDLPQREVFYNLLIRNEELTKRTRTRAAALSFCPIK